MRKDTNLTPKIRESFDAARLARAIAKLATDLADAFDFSSPDVALIGIQTRGVTLAHRIASELKSRKNVDIPVGAIDITLYRDDFSTAGIQPVIGETKVDFPIENKTLVLIDDVLFTGRTVRAAINEIMDFGRPQRIALAVLVDRGHRELPIQADFSMFKLSTKRDESVILRLKENDSVDELVICEAPTS